MKRHLLNGLFSTVFLIHSARLSAVTLPPPTDPATACANAPGSSDGGVAPQCGPGSGASNDSGCCPGDPDCDEDSNDDDIPPEDEPYVPCPDSSGSVIDNVQLNHRHFGHDYSPRRAVLPKALTVSGGGCASCAGGALSLGDLKMPKKSEFATLERVHSLRDCTYPSSLGPGVFLKDDKTLSISTDSSGNTSIVFYNPEEKQPKQFTLSGSQFVDATYNSAKGITLYDAAGAVTITPSSAVTARWVGYKGKVMSFELFPINSGLVGGRITSVQAAGGRVVKTYAYGTPVSAAATSPSSMWAKSSIADSYGHTINLSYATLSNGSVVLSTASLPASRQVVYTYDTSGNLANVALPGGDNTTITRAVSGSLLNVTYAEATERGTHRNKTVQLSNNIAASTISSHPLVYNQSSQLIRGASNGVGETTYWNTTYSGTGHRYVYGGGGTMRYVDNSTANQCLTSWSVASGKTGWSAVSGVVKSVGDVIPSYENPANLKGQPSSVNGRNGVTHAYSYDYCGNMISDTTSQGLHALAYDTTGFNRPLVDVDKNGNATVMAYDADGNMVSKTRGLASQVVSTPGQTVQGLVCTLYSAAPTSLGAISASSSATATSVFETFGFQSPVGASALLLQGNLTVATAGVRTFNFGTNYYAAQLKIDGTTISTRYYSQAIGSFNVNLTAGVHTISVYAVGGAKPTLTWSGPETTDASGIARTMPIGAQFLSHAAISGETIYVAPAGGSSTEAWTYYNDATLRDLTKSHTDPTGKITQYAYDSSRRLTQVQETGDAGSLVTVATYTYDSSTGNLISSTDAVGRTVTYAYDARDRLISTAYADNTTETVNYGTGVNSNLIVAKKDRNGSVTKFDYDSAGRNVTTTVGYALADNAGNITQVLSNPSVETKTYIDGTPDVLSATKDGMVTQYVYDYAHRLISSTQSPSTGKTLVISTKYSSSELKFCETDAVGCRTFFAYRSSDKKIIRVVRELKPGVLGASFPVAQPIPVLLAPGSYGVSAPIPDTDAPILALTRDTSPNPGYVVIDFTLDSQGNVTLETDPKGIQIARTYDTKNRLVSVTKAYGTSLAQPVTMTYDNADRPLTETDALSRVVTNSYTPAGRVATVTRADGKHADFTYYADGKIATRTDEDGFTSNFTWSNCCGREFGAANAQGQGTLKFHDGAGHVTYQVTVNDVASASAAVTWGSGINLPSAAVVSAQTARYDARGRVVASTRWNSVPGSVDPHNPPIATAGSSAGFTTTYAYFDDLSDPRFAPVLTQLTAQDVTLTAGSAVIVTNPAGNQRFTIFDGAGREVAAGAFN